MNRRFRIMRIQALIALLLAMTALAGCTSNDSGDDDGDGDHTPDPGTMPETPTFEDAPMGSELSTQEIQELALVFSDSPLTGGQDPWPSHLLKWISDDAFLLLHLDNEDPLEATQVLWYGLGVRGVFCSEDQPTPDFTHFHQRSAPTYAEGHAGQPGAEGYWLMHLNVRDFDSPFGNTGLPGVHEQFGPTPPEDCGDDYQPATFDPVGSDGLSAIEREAFAAVFDDDILKGGQQPWPSHLTKWVSKDTFILLHFDNESPTEASKILWMGLGYRSTFCDTTQPDPDFTHFHKSHAETYAEGHGGVAHQPGFWLLHVATHDFESPFGQTGGPGVHAEFGPTPAPEC